MFVRAYLRASTTEQDASRARDQLKTFAGERGLSVAAWYTENGSVREKLPGRNCSGSSPTLSPATSFWSSRSTSRLTSGDWERLKAELTSRHVRVVALDLPTSWMMATKNADEFTSRIFEAINNMLLDMLAAVARKDYDDRRRRQAQGQAKAKADGKYKGRPEDTKRNDGIATLRSKQSWNAIQSATGCSRATIAKIAAREKTPQTGAA